MLRPCYLTQKQAEMFRKYCNSSATSLHDVYKSWSAEKEEAFKACLSDMKRNGGQDMRITGASPNFFSCAYSVKREDGAYLVYHTYANRFEFMYMEERED